MEPRDLMAPRGPKESTIHPVRFSFLESRQAPLERLADSVPTVRRDSSDYQVSMIPRATLEPPASKAEPESAEPLGDVGVSGFAGAAGLSRWAGEAGFAGDSGLSLVDFGVA
jgi:hypothetical protein